MKPISVKLTNSPQASFKYKWIKLDSFEFNWHCHHEYELMYMVKSRGKRFIGDSISYYQEGELFLIGPNLPHTWYATQSQNGRSRAHEAILVQFLENFAGLNAYDVPEMNAIYRLYKQAEFGVEFFGGTRKDVSLIMKRMKKTTGIERLTQLLMILDILGKAPERDYRLLSSHEFKSGLHPAEHSRIDRVCKFINANYRENIRLKDAAAILNMTVTAFSRFFKRSTGKTFVEYVNELRVGLACKMLIESEQSIAEICFAVGFNNLSNFNRRFHERHLMSPRAYRKEFSLKAAERT